MQQLGIPGNKIKTVFEPLQKLHLPQQVRLEEKVRGVNTSSSRTAESGSTAVGSSPGSSPGPSPGPSQLQFTSPTPRLTETRALPTPTTPGSQVYSNISDKSKADYSVYVIKDQNQVVVAVLVETKLTSSVKFPHALAQVRSNIIVWGWGVSSLLTCRSLATI